MLQWRLQIDEDFPQNVAEMLEQHGLLIRRPDIDQLGMGDPEWLQWCFERDFVICTCNLNHFLRLNNDWRAKNRLHCGILGIIATDTHEVMAAKLLRYVTDHSPNDLVGEMVVLGETYHV